MSGSPRPHIAVIDPAVRVPELDNFNRLVLDHAPFAFSLHLPALFGMGSLESLPRPPDALIIFGSGASVYDQLPWQELFNAYLRDQIQRKIPMLGICYGHQLLAHLLGGTITYATEDQYKYKGLRSVHFCQSGFWGKAGEEGAFVVSHREIVKTLPNSCSVFAESATAGIEGFYHESLPLWGIQSHPEAGPEFLKNSEIPLEPSPQTFVSGRTFLKGFFHHLFPQYS